MTSLDQILNELGSVIVAYSGGVDSTYLAYEANRVLGANAIAVTADSASMPREELDEAIAIASRLGFRHDVVRTDEFTRDAYLRNAPDRCYHCKEALFDAVFPFAASRGIAYVAIGTVTDDLGDVRPGLTSARQRGARQPLLEAGLSKADVRSRALATGVPVWDKPAAACLSSRIPHGTPVTTDALRRVERAEAGLHALGFTHVRVRHHGELARIEVPLEDLGRLKTNPKVLAVTRAAGYREVEIDERGYRPAGLPIITR